MPAKTGVKASVERRSTRRSSANAENSVCELHLVAEWRRRDAWLKVDFKEADRQSLLYAASEPTPLSTPGTGREPGDSISAASHTKGSHDNWPVQTHRRTKRKIDLNSRPETDPHLVDAGASARVQHRL